MTLTSPVLPYLLAALAIALLVWVVAGWGKMAGQGWRQIVLRAASLLALQACVLSWVFVTVNRTSEFYASWSDLFGTINGTARVVTPRQTAVPTARLRPLLVASNAKVRVAGVQAAGGTLKGVIFNGQVSGLTVAGHIYLPPGYRTAGRVRSYPVIVAITDRAASPRSPYSAIRLAETAAREIALGKLRPLILVVLPAAVTATDQGCLNLPAPRTRPGSPARPAVQAQTFFAEDLPAILESAFHAASGARNWALLGDSTGGYCALGLALENPWDFSVAAAPRGTYARPPGAALPDSTKAFRKQDNLVWLLGHQPMEPVSILFTGSGLASAAGPDSPILAMAERPLRVSEAELSRGSWPLAAVLDWIGRSIGSRASQLPAG